MSVRLDDQKDRSSIMSMGDNRSDYIKLDKGDNFILLLSVEGEVGYEHWVRIGESNYKRTCSGGEEGGGWSPDECEICELTQEQYDLKKEAKNDGDDKLADEYNKKGNDLRAQFGMILPAIKFQGITVKVRDKKGKVKRKNVPDMESDFKIGKFRLTKAQTKKLVSFIEEGPEQIKEGTDLEKYILNFRKEQQGDKLYAELESIKLVKRIKIKELDIAEDQIPDLTDEYEENDDLDKIVALYRSGGEDEEDYEEDDLFADSEEEDENEVKPRKKSKANSKKKSTSSRGASKSKSKAKKSARKKPVEDDDEDLF